MLWFVFFFKQKTAYERRISDWSSDVCSSDLKSWLVDHRAARHVDEHAFGSERVEHRAVHDLVGGRPAGADGDEIVAVARHLNQIRIEALGNVLLSAAVIGDLHVEDRTLAGEIGRAGGREKGCKYV